MPAHRSEQEYNIKPFEKDTDDVVNASAVLGGWTKVKIPESKIAAVMGARGSDNPLPESAGFKFKRKDSVVTRSEVSKVAMIDEGKRSLSGLGNCTTAPEDLKRPLRPSAINASCFC